MTVIFCVEDWTWSRLLNHYFVVDGMHVVVDGVEMRMRVDESAGGRYGSIGWSL